MALSYLKLKRSFILKRFSQMFVAVSEYMNFTINVNVGRWVGLKKPKTCWRLLEFKTNGPIVKFSSAEVQKSAREFSHGLEFRKYFVKSKGSKKFKCDFKKGGFGPNVRRLCAGSSLWHFHSTCHFVSHQYCLILEN